MEKQPAIKTAEELFSSEVTEILTPIFESLENVSFTVEPNRGTSVALDVKFPEDMDSFDKDSLFKKIELHLEKNGVTVVQFLGSGPAIITWRLDKSIIDGKFNWSMFLPYPQKFSDKNKAVLNRISDSELLQSEVQKVNGDLLHKFSSYVKFAAYNGLITDEEKKGIENEYYTVAHY